MQDQKLELTQEWDKTFPKSDTAALTNAFANGAKAVGHGQHLGSRRG